MVSTYPGTTIEVSGLQMGGSRTLFDGIFATGGITLSQVSRMTGLEPHTIQNWVKRKFISPPINKTYSREQFARIIIINMLRETLQIDIICNLIRAIDGVPNDPTDDLIASEELYHIYSDMVCRDIAISDRNSVEATAERICESFEERIPGDKKKLSIILQTMLYAHAASQLGNLSKEMLASLK